MADYHCHDTNVSDISRIDKTHMAAAGKPLELHLIFLHF